ncbi:MAG TPA: helicase-associated domain-containing protein [Ktedonobacteraceae bacterium]
MDDVVPGVLQRLREADIVGLAGLASASLGQEHCRSGHVSTTKRQGARLSGIVTIPDLFPSAENGYALFEPGTEGQAVPGTALAPEQQFEVEVEVLNSLECEVVCSCGKKATLICIHAAALLYQWVAHPHAFVPLLPRVEVLADGSGKEKVVAKDSPVSTELSAPASFAPVVSRYASLPPRHQAVNTIGETLAQFGLSELRALAREYGVTQAGLSKQPLLETMLELLHQPEAIRRVVSGLEKPQRQLLAAFALAGGSMSDEDLRGLFERFSLGNTGNLQDMLVALQAKVLIVRTSFNHSLQPRFHAGLAPLDISWYIPQEVREALHVALPVTPFNVEVPYGKGANPSLPALRMAEPYTLLEDLLLVARALDGYALEPQEKRSSRSGSLLAARGASDGSLALPPPEDQPARAMIERVGAALTRPVAFLRFAVRLLSLTDLLYKEENWQTELSSLADSGRLLLGPTRYDALHSLFTRWLNQSSYAELYELSEHGLRVRCRATPLNQPDLRRGELEQENNEARHDLLALLAQVPLGEWVNFSAFARFVYRLRPTFLQRRQRLFPSPHWWIEQDEGRPLHPTQLADWLRAEGRYLTYLLQGPLHWWGLCDLAISSGDQLLAFRLTPMANFLFHGQELVASEKHSAAPGEQAVTVFASDYVAIACRPANWPLIACVERFAEKGGVRDEKLVYRLTARSLSQALGQGYDPGELLSALANAAAPGTEDDLRQLLARLERRIASYGRVRLYSDVSLLQTADASVMQHLAAITSLDEQTIRPIQPTLLLLKKQGIERLLEELKRRGQAPLLHEEG